MLEQHHNHHNHDLSFQWNTHSGCFTSAVKDALVDDVHEAAGGGGASTTTTSSDPFPRFTDMLISSPSPSDTSSSSAASDLSEKLLLKTISGFPAFAAAYPGGGGGGGMMPFFNPSANFGGISNYFMMPAATARVGGGSGNNAITTTTSSFIYPSINVASLNQQTAPPLDMNLQALDLLTANSSGHQNDLMGSHLRVDHHHHNPNYGLDHNHHHQDQNLMMRQYCSPSNTKVSSGSGSSSTASFKRESSSTKTTTEAKRSSSGSSSNDAPAAKATSGSTTAANKKSKLDQPRASCPPFKVRKEKLGDRIAALQQLVAPFGKTDTASVLMEAIGYIKFLQNQVETLSVPYMKSTRNKPARPMHFQTGATGEVIGNGEPTTSRDLRSRGLCLVPLSCMSYVTSIDGGSIAGAMWPPPPPNFGGGT